MLAERDIRIISQLRKDGRMTLTELSKRTGVPVSTAFERLKALRSKGLVKFTALVDFGSLGFNSRVFLAIKVNKGMREKAEEYLTGHSQVNSVYRINNGFTLMIDGVFRDNMREAEDFIEELESRFRIRKREVFFILGEVKREAVLSDSVSEVIQGGN